MENNPYAPPSASVADIANNSVIGGSRNSIWAVCHFLLAIPDLSE
jgi:hypothetical protein